ncbi:MAG: AhpC/TSA family protein [Muribaculaceae bacterium]|nr:AhpC/TSA family protein [Muribaculaceae bacterium]
MKINFKSYLAAAAAMLCATAQAAPYHVIAPMSDDDEGAMVYMVNYDTGATIDSVLVAHGAAEFRGEIDEPVLARLLLDGQRYATFILEEGGPAINKERNASGSMLNDRLNAISGEIYGMDAKFSAATDEKERQAIYDAYTKFVDATISENADNPISYYLFLDMAPALSPAQFAEAIAKYPSLAGYERVQRYQKSFASKAATAEGQPFTDFEIEYNGTTHRLSDVVGHGDYVLVDYWASWCGPCIRQTAVIKDIYNEYKDKGLKVLGVAVWDEPDATLAAIEKHDLPWECWLNGQSIPTDLYGIMGIPCIILYGPDGTILSRDKQSEELKAAVRAAMGE